MKKLTSLSFCLGCIFAVSTSHAIDLKQSKVTQVVNDVQIISAANQQQKAALVNDVFTMPDILSTGPASRAELVAADETVTRVGANTIFSFDPASRTINLKQGSLLFHSPHGKGGGTIHTGSATASVLGTTLIVTTTPTGGMKVLDLEGQVEVKFLNGLKQNLAPGHMTFVLPGGNQLTPIIVFRLDNLTQNSRLVNGFNNPLASMPLIQQQINQQIKAIEDHKLTDTGLEVGYDANGNQVQVIDLNTLQAALDQSFINSGAVTAALMSDATINQPSLSDAGIPIPPARIFVDPAHQFNLPGNTFYTGQGFSGFAAKNLYFNTINPGPLTVNMSPYVVDGDFYLGSEEFDFVAAGNLTLAGSVEFQGLSGTVTFSLVAGNQIIVAPDTTIIANTPNFKWQSAKTITLDGVDVGNNLGNTAFGTGDGFVVKNNAYIHTAANLTALTLNNISINNATLVADSTIMDSAHGSIALDTATVNMNSFGTFTAKNGDVTVNGSAFNVPTLTFNAPNGAVSITGTYLQAQTLNVSANTINLHNVALTGTVSLQSLVGQVHNGSSSFGYVNLLGGNTYNGQAFSAEDGFSGTIAGTGITVGPRPH